MGPHLLGKALSKKFVLPQDTLLVQSTRQLKNLSQHLN